MIKIDIPLELFYDYYITHFHEKQGGVGNSLSVNEKIVMFRAAVSGLILNAV